MDRLPGTLSVGEWAVLALVVERPGHGFALAQELAPGGAVGRVWSVPRPLVYRAIDMLRAKGLVEERGHEPGDRGPRRTVLGPTPSGRRLLGRWLAEPVEHVRDVRSLLLLKLLFLERQGGDAQALLDAQLTLLAPVAEALEQRARSAQGFDRTLARWRAESAGAVLRFLDHARKDGPSRSSARA
jgi:PadR family transcriptional regulator AphA